MANHPKPEARPMEFNLTPLEPRTLLAATLTDGLLDITGTAGNDVILLRESPAGTLQLTIAGQAQTFPLSDINRIRIRSGRGNDRVLSRIDKPVILQGGEGDDRLTGSSADDQIDGGPGSDTLIGNEGNDRILGAIGDDRIRGSAGNDTLRGGRGNDRLEGDEGDDFLGGDADANFLFGGRGSDRPTRATDILRDLDPDDVVRSGGFVPGGGQPLPGNSGTNEPPPVFGGGGGPVFGGGGGSVFD
jgi:Ca2+-binding RTX toxin-like protein